MSTCTVTNVHTQSHHWLITGVHCHLLVLAVKLVWLYFKKHLSDYYTTTLWYFKGQNSQSSDTTQWRTFSACGVETSVAWPISSVSQGGLWEFKQSLSVWEYKQCFIIISNSSPGMRSCYIKAVTSCCSNDQLNRNCFGMADKIVRTKMQIGAFKCRPEWDAFRRKTEEVGQQREEEDCSLVWESCAFYWGW